MKNIHINDSYNIWSITKMKKLIKEHTYFTYNPEEFLNRKYFTMYIEWWLHNIGYYITKPFVKNHFASRLNGRFRDVDLEGWK